MGGWEAYEGKFLDQDDSGNDDDDHNDNDDDNCSLGPVKHNGLKQAIETNRIKPGLNTPWSWKRNSSSTRVQTPPE